MTELSFQVRGLPVPQGSKNVFTNRRTGKPILVEAQGTKLEVWRTQVALKARQFAAQAHWEQPEGPVKIHVVFFLPRPKSHYRTGRHAGKLKHWAPTHCHVKPDGDKLLRAVFDALTMSEVIRDDAQFVTATYDKMYCTQNGETGAHIILNDLIALITGEPRQLP